MIYKHTNGIEYSIDLVNARERKLYNLKTELKNITTHRYVLDYKQPRLSHILVIVDNSKNTYHIHRMRVYSIGVNGTVVNLSIKTFAAMLQNREDDNSIKILNPYSTTHPIDTWTTVIAIIGLYLNISSIFFRNLKVKSINTKSNTGLKYFTDIVID